MTQRFTEAVQRFTVVGRGFVVCVMVLLWGLAACRAEIPEPAAPVTITRPSATPTASSKTVLPTATLTMMPPTPTSTTIPSPTPILLDTVTHQLVTSDGRKLIWMGADGEGQVLEPETSVGYPDLSPDGRFMAYVTNVNSWQSHIIIHPLDGSSNPLDLEFTWDQLVLSPDWSPDGQQLVFAGDLKTSGQNPDLYIVSLADPTEATLLFAAGSFDLDPVWSPNGREIAFTSDGADYGDYDIYLINADGTDLRQATLLDGDEREPAWSPDGQYLAFVFSAPDQPEDKLAILPQAQFGDPEQEPLLIDHPGSASFPVWSDDGQLVGFVAEGQLFVADLAGNVQPVLFVTPNIWHMDWQFSRDGVGVSFGES